MMVKKNESNNQLSQTQAQNTEKQCLQALREEYYILQMTASCGLNDSRYHNNISQNSFEQYRNIRDCNIPNSQQKSIPSQVSNAIDKKRQQINDDQKFCDQEFGYYQKLLKKYL